MTINELAHSAQQHLLASTGTQVKRTHIYELLAATFGFRSYAAFNAAAVFTERHLSTRTTRIDDADIRHRCAQLGYQPEVANAVSLALPAFLALHHIGAIRIAALVNVLRGELARHDGYPAVQDDPEDDGLDERNYDRADRWAEPDDLAFPILLDGLETHAAKGRALAHYALALLHAPDDEDEDREVGRGYWYSQAQKGLILTGVEKEWADAEAACLAKEGKYARHLREAARLGQRDAMLELAEQFDDPAFFEQESAEVNADPAFVAEIAERLGRQDDARKWLTKAAESGDTEAMRQLIEEYDHGDLQRCWTWIYLAELFGTDLTKDDYYAIDEHGSPYDDDVGGPAYVGGQDGVKLDPISPEQDAAARLAAERLFREIEPTSGK